MRITARGLNRATLARQLLLRRERYAVTEAVHRVVALQAQHAASPYLALWNRLDGFDPADLDAAITGREVVKATLMRITLHVVHAADYHALREGMEPTLRAARLRDNRFTISGLTVEDAQALIPGLLEYADRPRTAVEMEGWCQERMGTPETRGRSVVGATAVRAALARSQWDALVVRPAPVVCWGELPSGARGF